MTEKFFNSKYPIMEALMNGGSDLALALAVADAGAFPSYWHNKHNSVDQLYQDIKEFVKCIGNSNIVIGGVDTKLITNADFLKIVRELKISHIEMLATDHRTGEVLTVDNLLSSTKLSIGLKSLKKTSKILTRIYDPIESELSATLFDAYCIKGKESAGKTGNFTVSELYDAQRKLSSNYLIPYGGIGTPGQVKDYINRGAPAVAIGTLIAACAESSLSTDAKHQLIKANSSSITKLSDTGQNSLLLDTKFKTSLPVVENDWNRDCYLEQGLQGNGVEGLLYVGKSVDNITEIKPVKDIIEYLVSELTT